MTDHVFDSRGIFPSNLFRQWLGRPWAVPGASFPVFRSLSPLSLPHTHAHTHTHTHMHAHTHALTPTFSQSLSDRAGRLHYPPVRSMLAMTGSSTGHHTIDTADSTMCVCVCVRVWWLTWAAEAMMWMSKWWAEVSKAHSLLPLLTISQTPCYCLFLSVTHTPTHRHFLFFFSAYYYLQHLTVPSTAAS